MKRRIQFSLICLLTALFLGQRAAAESPFIVDVWNTDDGLRQSSVIAMTQTRDGYLWLGTLNGLLRFDGNSFTPFNVNNTPGLTGNVIVFLYEDSLTNLWVVTDNGALCQIHDGGVKNFDVSTGNGKITAAIEDAAGAVWFATDGGDFFAWHSNLLEHVSGVQRAGLTDVALHGRLPARDGSFWYLKSGLVQKWRGNELLANFGPVPWTNLVVATACEDPEGNLVVGTRGAGVFWYDQTGHYQHVTKAVGLSEDYILSLCFDAEKNLWVGTDGGGLDRVKRKVFSTPDGLSGGVALSAAEDAQGGLWTTFNFQGVGYWLTNSLQHYPIGLESIAGPVLVDGRRQIWAGTSREGLFRFDLAAGRFNAVPGAAPVGGKIYTLFESHDGTLWAGGRESLGRFDGQVWTFYSTADGLPPYAVRALAEDSHGTVWIGTQGGGLFVLRDGKISATNAPFNDISCLLVDREGVVWAGTSAHGLARNQNGNWTVFTEDDGLINDLGYLIEDDLGNLWIGSYEGLLRVDKKSLADHAREAGRKISCRTFLTRECSAGAQPAAIRAHDGRLWFPTTEGFVSLYPAELKPDTNPPPVVIESVAVDGVPQNANRLNPVWTDGIRLLPENDQLEIRFTALNFSAPKRARLAVQFQYKLAGYDKNWTDLGATRVAHFPKLPPGSYVFRVKACNEDGVWNETGAALAITVEPPFWRKPGFLLVSALAFLGLLAGTIYLVSTAKLKRQLRVLHQKELIERERARIARDLHDQLGANLTQVTLLGEMAEADKDLPGEVEQHAQQICATARETTHALDEIVWAVNPSNDTLEGLANYACKYAQDYFALAGVSYRAELPPNLPPTPILPEVRHNVFLAFKEAVNNVVKHARATEARVKLQLYPDKFILSVTDNGRGLGDVSGKSLRNGLKNMRKRLADVRGEFEIVPGAGGGTVVRLTVPVAQK